MKARIVVALLAADIAGAAPALADPPPQPVPEVVSGFTMTPLAAVAAPTALAFGPGTTSTGPDLYVATLDATTLVGLTPPSTPESTTSMGDIVRLSLLWTPAGPLMTGMLTFATGFSQPLGVVFDQSGVMYVSDSHPGTESCRNPQVEGCRTDGRITQLATGQSTQGQGTVIVDGLPNGRHNTNHLRFGPGSRLYIANGNPNDAGCLPVTNTQNATCPAGSSDRPDVFPYSGAVLSVDPAVVSQSPAILHWVNSAGQRIDESLVASDPINADFAAKVPVLAHGFRNIFGVAFAPSPLPFAGTAYTGMNGSDGPASQDVLFRITSGTNYGFPFCFNQGTPGAVGSGVSMAINPNAPGSLVDPVPDCSLVSTGTALLGWHVCATGIDFPIDAQAGFVVDSAFPANLRHSVFVGECTPFFIPDLIMRILADPSRATFNTGHKVVRVELDGQGNAVAVNDFVTGLILNTDELFGPDGALYIADAEGILRVAPTGL